MPPFLSIGFPRALLLAILSAVGLHLLGPGVVAAQEAGAAADQSEPARLASRSLLLDAVQVGERTIAVGDRGHILINDDPAVRAWTQITVPTHAMLTAITATGDGRLWAVGHDAVILNSSDAGESWQLQNIDPELETPLLDVWFEENGHGLAVGAYGLAYETFDGGKSWERRTIDEDEPHFYTLFETAGGALVLAGEFGTVLRSTDRGATWVRLESPYEGSFFGGLGLSDGTLLLFGLRGNLYRSSDGGQTWGKIESGVTASLLGAAERENGTVAVVGLSGTLLQSNDGGMTFSLTSGLRREGLNAVLQIPDTGLLLVGESGVSLLTAASSGAATGSAQ